MKKAVVLLSGGLDSATALALATRDGFDRHAPAGLDAGVDFNLTVSGYQTDDGGSACGGCGACHIRRAGFAAGCIGDRTLYLQHA